MQTLSKSDVEKYYESVSFLRSIVTLFQTMQFGQGNWRPVQTGVILATNAILELAEEVLSNNLQFLLTSRLTQDCLENLFSTVRLKTATPSIREFRNSLKIITVAQCLKTPRNSSYQVDEAQFLANYIEKIGSDKEE